MWSGGGVTTWRRLSPHATHTTTTQPDKRRPDPAFMARGAYMEKCPRPKVRKDARDTDKVRPLPAPRLRRDGYLLRGFAAMVRRGSIMRAFCIICWRSRRVRHGVRIGRQRRHTGRAGRRRRRPDGGTRRTAGRATYPAFKVDAPQVVSLGGPVLTTPKVQPVFFPGFDYATQITDFTCEDRRVELLGCARGVQRRRASASATPIALGSGDPARRRRSPTRRSRAWLKARFDGTHPEFGTTPDPSTDLRALLSDGDDDLLSGGGGAPDGGVPDGGGGFGDSKSCTELRRLPQRRRHRKRRRLRTPCSPSARRSATSTASTSPTATTSHELSEAATDPFPTAQPAYDAGRRQPHRVDVLPRRRRDRRHVRAVPDLVLRAERLRVRRAAKLVEQVGEGRSRSRVPTAGASPRTSTRCRSSPTRSRRAA